MTLNIIAYENCACARCCKPLRGIRIRISLKDKWALKDDFAALGYRRVEQDSSLVRELLSTLRSEPKQFVRAKPLSAIAGGRKKRVLPVKVRGKAVQVEIPRNERTLEGKNCA